MGRLNAPLLALALGAVAAMALAACGSSGGADLLPGDTAKEISANLDQVKALANEGECVGAEDAAQQVSAQVDALGGVDKRLKQALREGATRLSEVVESCEEEEAPEETEAIETAVEPEPPEKKVKPGKPAKTKAPKEEPAETTPEPPVTPPAGGDEGNEEDGGEAPAGEDGGTPSGGVGPGAPAESE
jgi:outer membrane biosynthesis protein TonB